MKFGDKLIELRKKNGYSQEELAEKLGVSRQSVSKWESNNTYPETDKIIQIANLFDCSMDDLINDKITDVESSLRKNKNNFNNVWDSLLEFITNTVNMFSKMKFSDGLRCIIEMIILGLLLGLFGKVICGVPSSVISNIFRFLGSSKMNLIREVLNSILSLVWFIIAIIILIYTFKIRYLNYYVEEKAEPKKEKIKDKEKQNENVEKDEKVKNEKIIVRDEKPFEFLGVLSKIAIIFIKFIVFWILVGTIFTTISLVVSAVIAISHVAVNIIFLWITLLLIAAIIVLIQFIILLISFIFNKKFNLLPNLIIFISCIVVIGFSIGMLALSIKNIEVVEDNSLFNLETKEIKLKYKDNLVIDSNGLGLSNKYKYIIDNSIEENQIIVSRELDSRYFKLTKHNTTMDNMPVIMIEEEEKNNFKVYYELFINNLKENKLYTFESYGNDPLVIKANENTISKLTENQKKLYLVEEKVKDGEIDITVHQDKVYFEYGLEGEYNAIDDTIKYNVDNYSCKKTIEATEYGERIIYACDSNDVSME